MFHTSVTSAMMEKALGGLWQRAGAISNNLANEDTPGYKAQRVEFEDLLRQELYKQTDTRMSAVSKASKIESVAKIQPRIVRDESTSMRIDGNNVDVDSEHIEMARTQIHYNTLVQKLNGHYSTLEYVISGGR